MKYAKYHDIYSGLSYSFWDGYRNQNSRKYWLNPARDPIQNGISIRLNKVGYTFAAAITSKEDMKAYYEHPVQIESGVTPPRVFKLS